MRWRHYANFRVKSLYFIFRGFSIYIILGYVINVKTQYLRKARVVRRRRFFKPSRLNFLLFHAYSSILCGRCNVFFYMRHIITRICVMCYFVIDLAGSTLGNLFKILCLLFRKWMRWLRCTYSDKPYFTFLPPPYIQMSTNFREITVTFSANLHLRFQDLRPYYILYFVIGLYIVLSVTIF